MLIYLQMLDTPEERAKFETLYHAHRRTMLHIAMQILKDHQLAEDAVQEAFLRLVKNFSKIGQINCPRTRLFTVIIVRNISLTMLAERKKETVLESPDAVIPIEYDLEEDVLERIAYEEVLNAIRELPVAVLWSYDSRSQRRPGILPALGVRGKYSVQQKPWGPPAWGLSVLWQPKLPPARRSRSWIEMEYPAGLWTPCPDVEQG